MSGCRPVSPLTFHSAPCRSSQRFWCSVAGKRPCTATYPPQGQHPAPRLIRFRMPGGGISLKAAAATAGGCRTTGWEKKMLKEFKGFAMRGNGLDMAIGIVIGAAFGRIVSSFVADILMPPIGLLLAGVDFSNIFVTLSGGEYASLSEAQAAGAATWNIGLFISA